MIRPTMSLHLGVALIVAAVDVHAAPADGRESLKRLEAALGSGTCVRDEDCRTIGVGALPCGGPESYRAYSVLDTKPKKLARLAAHHAEERRLWYEKLDLSSTCEVRPDPGARCDRVLAPGRPAAAGRCKLGTIGAGIR